MHKLTAQRERAAGCPFEEEEEPAPKAAPEKTEEAATVVVQVPAWFQGSLKELHDALREVIETQMAE